MKIIEIIIADLFEGISKDELIKNLQQKRQASYLDMILKKMHELVQSQGDRQSIGNSAFEISKYLGGAISGRELEQMYRKKYISESQVNEWGRVVKGVNTTVDVGTDEIKRQAAKFGNTVDKDGFPPSMSTVIKSKPTNVKYHTPVKESELPRYTAAEWAIIEGGHSLEDLQESKPPMPKQPGKLFTSLTEGYKLQLERDEDVLVLHIKDNASGKRTEVRGKPGYETNGYDANDPLHKLLDVVGKSANISELMNGEVVTINPKHPNAQRALAATDRAYNEAFDTDVEWVEGPGAGGSTVYAAMVDKAYIEITYKPMSKGVYINFTRGGVMSVTGEGSQNKVFGAVINHIKQWVAKNKPEQIVFSAWKPRTGAFGSQDTTRSGLYRKMVQRFASQNGYDYDVEDTGNEDTFILKRQTTDTQTTESLDNPYPVRWSIKDDDEWEGKAKTQAGDSIQIMITQGHNNHKWEVDFYVGGSMQVTGKGDQFRIFATIVSAVKKWWAWLSKSKQPVEAISFSAFKGNKNAAGSAGRSNLYSRFANQFARSIGFNVSTVDGSDNIKFVLTNPNYKNQQTENFADGKKPGRKGLAKRSGVNTKASVSSLRKTAKSSSGEKQRMAHWLANMKAGKAKKK